MTVTGATGFCVCSDFFLQMKSVQTEFTSKLVLCLLMMSIRFPLVDEIKSNCKIPKVIVFLNSCDLYLQVLALECVLETCQA
ncbi:hypothetical protein VIGAN_04209900 [Vigna angularis var. angularis]|uniref:Uncharacterized protein n=1 Tax=Vigna angularis var. angularis TaxID=157739 RepID=A0A0S3RVQ0_PHAAN|nr:hypothetical protein VIGAN_04209900 [Vigna angularis var. angularis]